jgi:hypothetical protein
MIMERRILALSLDDEAKDILIEMLDEIQQLRAELEELSIEVRQGGFPEGGGLDGCY